MDIFNTCQKINEFILKQQEVSARNLLIQLLDYLNSQDIQYSPLVNHLIRETGLYPYIQPETSSWQDKFVHQAFKVDAGGSNQVTLHREQSALLKSLLDGENIAVSAPTSFGKSFVIDAFISIKKPKNIVLIVPTIALTDETRRRLYKKFSTEYKIITTPDVELAPNNILIFPQERAINYINKLESIDILIIDEFYKAGISFDRERAPVLLKAILELGKKAKQKYFLAPNISDINQSPFTEGMKFEKIDFNTVFSEIHRDYLKANQNDISFKKNRLLSILNQKKTKTLIYAGTYSNIDKIVNILQNELQNIQDKLLESFSDWLKNNYGKEYILSDLVHKGVGIHNGRLHRSLSQLQVRLFEEPTGLNNIISTSSIIEGVNTSAENVIIWANKNGRPNLNNFTYKNIVGRGGRMFKHFIGKIYLFEAPPEENPAQLKLEFTDELLNSLDTDKFKNELTREQIIKIIAFNDEMDKILGNDGVYKKIINDPAIQTCNSNSLRDIAIDMTQNRYQWNGLRLLNSNNPQDWETTLYKVLKYLGGNTGTNYTNLIAYIKAISNNWNKSIPEIINLLNITIEKYFELERVVSFNLSNLLGGINTLQKYIFQNYTDISPFIFKTSHAFLPKLVYELEEYGLPRMISRKIHNSGLINLEQQDISINDIISEFNDIGKSTLEENINLHHFERYILNYFFDGISSNKQLINF
ncbi:DEAD/DEAH box helicase [Ornithobacterium rhinotracheale]